MLCVLFTWFENVQCNFDTAVTHLQSGVKILADWRAKSNRALQEAAVQSSKKI